MINLMVKCFIKLRKKKLWDEVLVNMVQKVVQKVVCNAHVKSIVGIVPTTENTFVNTFVDVNDFVSIEL